MNPFTVLVVAILAVLVALAVCTCVKNRKKGCNGSCGGCPWADSCEKREKT